MLSAQDDVDLPNSAESSDSSQLSPPAIAHQKKTVECDQWKITAKQFLALGCLENGD
jgi:hypothetical protein